MHRCCWRFLPAQHSLSNLELNGHQSLAIAYLAFSFGLGRLGLDGFGERRWLAGFCRQVLEEEGEEAELEISSIGVGNTRERWFGLGDFFLGLVFGFFSFTLPKAAEAAAGSCPGELLHLGLEGWGQQPLSPRCPVGSWRSLLARGRSPRGEAGPQWQPLGEAGERRWARVAARLPLFPAASEENSQQHGQLADLPWKRNEK